MSGHSGSPVWPALTYLTADCNYGGRVSNNYNYYDDDSNDDNNIMMMIDDNSYDDDTGD